jgi:hypothetical protein
MHQNGNEGHTWSQLMVGLQVIQPMEEETVIC